MAVVERPTTWFEDMTEILGKFEPVLLDCVRAELERLASGQGKKARLASVALNLAASFKVQHCGGAAVDDEIISAGMSLKGAVATADGELQERLEALGVRVVSLRAGRVALR
jgi:rRNA-processing protein FCF1